MSKICKKLHEFEGKVCEICHRERSNAYRVANLEKVKAAKAAHYKANPEKTRARSSAWYADNKERAKIASAARYAADPAKAAMKGAARYALNPEKFKARSKARYAANPDKSHAYDAAYRIANKEKIRVTKAAYRDAHPDACAIKFHTRRARKIGNGGVLSKGLFNKLFLLQKGLCIVCRAKLSDTKPRSPMDHIMPLALGGPNTDANIQLLCSICNNQKNAKHPIDFMQSRGFLL